MATKNNKAKGKGNKTTTKNTRKNQYSNELRKERPVGITGIMGKWNKLKDTKLIQSAQSIYINQYIHEGTIGYVDKDVWGMERISRFLRLGPGEFIKRISESTTNLLGINGTGEEQMEGINRVVISKLLGMALADRALISEQVHNLRREQGAGYVPFLSSAYNQVLKLGIESQKPFLELLRALNPTAGPNTNILIQTGNKRNNVPDANSVSTSEAMRLIDANRNGTTLLEDENSKMDLFAAYVQNTSLPEVIATKQIGNGMNDGGLMPTKKKRHEAHEERNEANGTISILPV